jgi:DNA-binding NtrC family response regulator
VKEASVLALAWDHENHLVEAARSVVESAPAFIFRSEVIGEPNSEKCITKCRAAIDRLKPNLALVPFEQNTRAWMGDVLQACREAQQGLPVLILAGEENPKQITDVLASGPEDFVTPPIRAADLLPRLWKLSGAAEEREAVCRELKEKLGLKGLIGESPLFLAAIRRISVVAKCDATVLIASETGTGKELCARAIHYLSARADKPFVPVNCGAIPVELVENELFGHEQGAFTGAHSTSAGLFRSAEGGTVLLDEIDSLPAFAQVKLLRFLQEGQLQPLGCGRPCAANVRIIAATNNNLLESVRSGRFRQDLYYRLNVVPIQMPALRDRKEDIPLLARHFLDKYAARYSKPRREISSRAQQLLLAYDWPGNVRELENVIVRALVLSESPVVQVQDICFPISTDEVKLSSFKKLKAKTIQEFERTYIQDLLLKNNGNITKASQVAGKNRRAFWQLMRKHRLVAALASSPKNAAASRIS